MNYNLKILPLIGILLCMIPEPGHSQIPPPNLKNATVNEDGSVELLLDYPDTTDMEIVVFRDYYQAGDWVLGSVARLNSIKIWSDWNSKANQRTHVYKISYYPPKQHLSSNLFNTIHCSAKLDTCAKNNNLFWTRYVKPRSLAKVSWNDSIQIKYYNIYRSVDGNGYQAIANSILPDNTRYIDSTIKGHPFYFFTDSNIEYNRNYKYYIEAVLASDTLIKSLSNRVTVNTEMPYDPEYIHFARLAATDNNKIEMQFNIAENTELDKYLLLRSQTLEGPYDTIRRFETSALSIKYTDNPGNPNKNIWFYHLASENSCGALTTRSDTMSNLLLNVAKENLMNQLDWNELNHINNNANITFNLYRQIGNQERELLNASYEAPYYDNKVQLYEGQGKSAKFCYEIEAEINHEAGYRSTLYSNRNCVYVKPRVFLPNAIIPNDPNNNTFKPEFTFEPDTYLLIVYNRQGVKMFEAKNKGWNGKTRNGKEVKPGTYIYYLEFKIPGEPLIRKRGEVTVVYSR